MRGSWCLTRRAKTWSQWTPLTRLAASPRRAQVVELRFFGGLNVEETAEALKVSSETGKRDSRLAKAWLLRAAMDDYPIWSPGGTRIIFASNRKGPDDLYWRPTDGSIKGGPGRPEIYLQPSPATGARVRLSTAAGGFPQWSPDGKQVFYCTGDSLAAVNVSAPAHPGVPQPLFAWP